MSQHDGRIDGGAIGLALQQDYRRVGAATESAQPSQTMAMQVLAVTASTLTLATAWFVPIPFVLATVSVLALALAGVSALLAWRWQAAHRTSGMNLWDVAGILALIGFGAAMLSEPDAVAKLLTARGG